MNYCVNSATCKHYTQFKTLKLVQFKHTGKNKSRIWLNTNKIHFYLKTVFKIIKLTCTKCYHLRIHTDIKNVVSAHLNRANTRAGPLAETWCKFWGNGVGALAPKKFFTVPQKFEIWGGRRGTHCLLELKFSSKRQWAYMIILSQHLMLALYYHVGNWRCVY